MNRDNYESLPQWMKDLWSLAPNIARQVEAHINSLESQIAAQQGAQADMGTFPKSGEYFVEYVESNVMRLTPRR